MLEIVPHLRFLCRFWRRGGCAGLTRSSSETFVGSKVAEELGHALHLKITSRFCNGARIVRRVLQHLAATTAGSLKGGSHLSFANSLAGLARKDHETLAPTPQCQSGTPCDSEILLDRTSVEKSRSASVSE